MDLTVEDARRILDSNRKKSPMDHSDLTAEAAKFLLLYFIQHETAKRVSAERGG